MLAYRSRSYRELVSSLREKGFSVEVVESVAAELEDKGLLDDARLARDIVTSGQSAKKSRSRIYADLRRRGIAREEAEESLQDCFDPEKEREVVAQLMSRGLCGQTDTPREADIERTARRLFRRGFSASAIADMLGDIQHGEDSCHEPQFLDTDSQLS